MVIISLQKQIHIYSVDTSAFYNKEEKFIHYHMNKYYIYKAKLKKAYKKSDDEKKEKINNYIKRINKNLRLLKNKLCKKFDQHEGVRELRADALKKTNIVSVFESALTRTMRIPENSINTDIIIVQTYFFNVLEDIILSGFIFNDTKYVCFTASAGQIRTKKTVFIKESVLLKHQKTLMCGLTPEIINSHGGININKYLAYLALCNSATDVWEDFDINKTIVVDDMETKVEAEVDYIDDKTYEITRKTMPVEIPHTDGCGMILPKKSKKSMMVRLPWIKGLLVPFPYDKFIKDNSENVDNCGIVKDVYGKEYDLIKDDIEVVFTKSQFKMWKYYKDWNQYKESFLKYQCHAGKCNEEEYIFNNAKLNYQMLQTLADMSDEEIIQLSSYTIEKINRMSSDKKTMLRVFGVTESNRNKTYLQKSLEIYPELLSDVYTKEVLKQIKKSIVKEARAGKLDVNGKYTFICPDLYAFCEFLILGEENPTGLLKEGEVFCKLYSKHEKLDCLRSPHLYREHAVRNNIIDDEKKKWFITKGLYTSVHDVISKILQFDVDGDKSLVCVDEVILKVAERNMKDIVPLFYNMAKAGSVLINNKNIYEGLKSAYTGGNIGMISNDITKIWNSEDILESKDALKAIKLLCMENNFVIDYAKTLYKPKRPSNKQELITKYTKRKTPHFFIYAKDKEKHNVEKVNKSLVNRLDKIIPNPRLKFSCGNLGKFNYKMLMFNKNIDIDQDIIDKYNELSLKKHFMINICEDDDKNNISYLFQEIKERLMDVNSDVIYIADVLVKYLYSVKKSRFKETLWICFGDIIFENLKMNIEKSFEDGYMMCEECGDRVKKTNNKQKYCLKCWKEIRKQQNKDNFKKWYEKQKI